MNLCLNFRMIMRNWCEWLQQFYVSGALRTSMWIFAWLCENYAECHNKIKLSWPIRMYLRIFAWLCQILSKEESSCNTLHLLVLFAHLCEIFKNSMRIIDLSLKSCFLWTLSSSIPWFYSIHCVSIIVFYFYF